MDVPMMISYCRFWLLTDGLCLWKWNKIFQAILLSGTLVKHSLEMAEQVEEHILQLLVINLNGHSDNNYT